MWGAQAAYHSSYQGNGRWVEQLETQFSEEFRSTKSTPWLLPKSGAQVGEVRSAGGGGMTAGNVTFVIVHNAGYVLLFHCIIQYSIKHIRHIAPHDQPEAALVCFVFSTAPCYLYSIIEPVG